MKVTDDELALTLGTGGPLASGPERGLPWYRTTLTVTVRDPNALDAADRERFAQRLAVAAVPRARLLRGETGAWMTMSSRSAEAYAQLTAGIRPRPGAPCPTRARMLPPRGPRGRGGGAATGREAGRGLGRRGLTGLDRLARRSGAGGDGSRVADPALRLGGHAPANRSVDRVGGQHVLDHHDRRADHARPVAQSARHDAQVLGRQRQRAPEGHLAHAGQELLGGLADVAADHDHLGVEEVDAPGQHLAEVAAGLADHPGRAGSRP